MLLPCQFLVLRSWLETLGCFEHALLNANIHDPSVGANSLKHESYNNVEDSTPNGETGEWL
jgi:hypothetical protein